MSNVLQELVSILVGGLQSMASGIASGLNAMATDLFIVDNSGTKTLSTFGGIVAVFGGKNAMPPISSYCC